MFCRARGQSLDKRTGAMYGARNRFRNRFRKTGPWAKFHVKLGGGHQSFCVDRYDLLSGPGASPGLALTGR